MPDTNPVRFTWTHVPNRGPDESLLRLRPGQRVLDLGCGRGTHLAYLCRAHQIEGVGIDHDPHLATAACTYLGGGTASFIRDDARAHLDHLAESSVDAIYSRFGAVWFTDPDELLPLIASRLRPGGRFVFSHLTPATQHPPYRAGSSHPRHGSNTLSHWDSAHPT